MADQGDAMPAHKITYTETDLELKFKKMGIRKPRNWKPEYVLYGVLDVEPSATAAEIKAAYRIRVLQTHPDKVASENREIARREFRRIQEAYDILSDVRKRKIYDTYGVEAVKNTEALVELFPFKNEQNPTLLELILAADLYRRKMEIEQLDQKCQFFCSLEHALDARESLTVKTLEIVDEQDNVVEAVAPNFLHRLEWCQVRYTNLSSVCIFNELWNQKSLRGMLRFGSVLSSARSQYYLWWRTAYSLPDPDHGLSHGFEASQELSFSPTSTFGNTLKYTCNFAEKHAFWRGIENVEVESEQRFMIDDGTLQPELSPVKFGLNLNISKYAKLKTTFEVKPLNLQASSLKVQLPCLIKPGIPEDPSSVKCQIRPFVKWSVLGLESGSEATISLTPDLTVELDYADTAAFSFKEAEGKSRHAEISIKRSVSVQFAYKLSENHAKGDSIAMLFGLALKHQPRGNQTNVDFTIGLRRSVLEFKLPIRLPDEAKYWMTSIGTAGLVAYGLKRFVFDPLQKSTEDLESEELGKTPDAMPRVTMEQAKEQQRLMRENYESALEKEKAYQYGLIILDAEYGYFKGLNELNDSVGDRSRDLEDSIFGTDDADPRLKRKVTTMDVKIPLQLAVRSANRWTLAARFLKSKSTLDMDLANFANVFGVCDPYDGYSQERKLKVKYAMQNEDGNWLEFKVDIACTVGARLKLPHNDHFSRVLPQNPLEESHHTEDFVLIEQTSDMGDTSDRELPD